MDIPSRPPPQTSPKKHRRQSTRHDDHHEHDGDHHDNDDDRSNVSAKSDLSVRTRNTQKIIRDASFSPKSGPYNPYADLPIPFPSTTQAPTPRSTTRPAHLEVDTTHYPTDRLRPPASGPSKKSEDPGREYSRSPGGRRVHYETARPPPSGPRSSGSRDNTHSRGYGQSPTSPGQSGQYSRSDKDGLRFPEVHMPQLEDYAVPSASAKKRPQYEEISPRDKRPALPSGYARPSNPNTAADYADAQIKSPIVQAPGGETRRPSRGSYPERGDDGDRRDSRDPAAPGSAHRMLANRTKPPVLVMLPPLLYPHVPPLVKRMAEFRGMNGPIHTLQKSPTLPRRKRLGGIVE